MIPPGQEPQQPKHWYFVSLSEVPNTMKHRISSFIVVKFDENGQRIGNDWTKDINKATKFTQKEVDKLSREWQCGRGHYIKIYM